jgi:uncharacterized membrane-anchored protein YjiN (DUF445 family)
VNERRSAYAPPRDADTRRAELRRMRTIATLLLVLMTAIFIVTSMARVDWPWLPYVRAFAEAGMVGACADWFAVVALFRHPLGIPIPHTAIIPNNRDRIGPALGRFITNNFLDVKVAHDRLAQVDILGRLAEWLNDPRIRGQIVDNINGALPKILRALPGPAARDLLGNLARYGIEAIPAAPTASKVLAVLWAGGAAEQALDRAIVWAELSLARNRDVIGRKVEQHSYRWVPAWVDRIIAERVMNGLLTTLQEFRNPEHPWRLELQQAVDKLIHDLANDPEMSAAGEAIKADLLANPLFGEQGRQLWTEIESGLRSELPARSKNIAQAFDLALHGLGAWLEQDEARRAKLNRHLRLMVLRLLLPRRAEIGAYVTQVVNNWDTATLVDRLELQVGKDLQFIRINGTLVGGLVGLLIFVVSGWLAPHP